MRMKRRIRTGVCLILCGVLVWFLADARQLRLEAAKALTLCAGTVIPALFPFIVVTGLLVRLGFGQWLAPDMAGLMASLFRLPGCAGSALLLGLVGGYPIGARTAAELYASGDLTRQEAERALAVCNQAGPSFIFGVLGGAVFKSAAAGAFLYAVQIVSAVLVCRLTAKKQYAPAKAVAKPPQPESFAAAFSARSLAAFSLLCFAISIICSYI